MVANERTELLTVKEVARRVDQHTITIYRRIARGELAAVRLGPGGRIRIPRRALEDFVQPIVTRRNPQDRED